MKPEAQRIAIAEACGWNRLDKVIGRPTPGNRDIWCSPDRDGYGYGLTSLPDYLNDLNAMHEAEKMLRPDGAYGQWPLWDKYFKQLTWAIGEEDAVHATAAQRAEAFLRAIGKWEEST